MKVTNVQIFDQQTQSFVQAEMLEDPGDDYIETVDALWSVYKRRTLRERRAAGKPVPEYSHWNWKLKLEQGRLENSLYECFAIVRDEPQGLMMLKYGSEFVCRYDSQQGKPMVYIAYIESAPWNVKEYSDSICYSGIGTEFYKTAVRFSHRFGFAGRVGLHSLPGAEGFYANTCHMVALGHDPKCDDLVYFESIGK
jgi:hypothetical protein